jgi:hypothetical protein
MVPILEMSSSREILLANNLKKVTLEWSELVCVSDNHDDNHLL